MSANVDTTNQALHGIGMVAMGGYGGIGLSYCACSTVTSFTQVHSPVGLVARLRSADADQDVRSDAHQPNPMGGCDAGSCYNYPALLMVAPPSSTPTTITTPLSSFSNWTSATAAEVVGLQWQWTSHANLPAGSVLDASAADAGVDASLSPCSVDATVTDIKFLP